MRRLAVMLVLASAPACPDAPREDGAGDAAPLEPWFEERAEASGLSFEHRSGHDRERYFMPEIMGGGAALFDADGDGDLDAYLVQGGDLHGRGGEGNRLYENDGRGTFADRTRGSGADDRGYGMGVAAGDADGDGDTDLYVTNVGRDVLLVNRGEFRFEDRTERSGLGDPGFGTSAAFVDVDLDGDLDLYVCRYLAWSEESERICRNELGQVDYCSPLSYESPAPDALLENDGRGGFSDVSLGSGVGKRPATGLGVVAFDVELDGWPEVFVANDGMPDFLWVRQPDGTLRDEAMLRGCDRDGDGVSKAGMGVAVADVDRDGDPDLLVCNLNRETDSLFLVRDGLFLDRTARFGLARASRPFTRFGVGLFDFDHDGRFDLFEANGRVMRQGRDFADDPYAEPNLLFRGRDGGFDEVMPRGGVRTPLVATSRAAAFGDVDGDLDLDVLVVNRDLRSHLLVNVRGTTESAAILDVVNEQGAPAIGAELVVSVAGREIRYGVRACGSYLASSDPRVHVGLGEARRIDRVRVFWTSGASEEFGPLEGGRVHRLRRGGGRSVR